jgi:hypothetical protein
VLDRVGFVLRALQAEVAVRLALWTPQEAGTYGSGLWRAPELAQQVAAHLPALTSRLVAERASAQFVGVLVEAVLRMLAVERDDLDDLEDAVRGVLGHRLLGELPLATVPVVVDADPAALHAEGEASLADLRAELLAQVPELTTETRLLVVRVPSPTARRRVSAALRPLGDVVRVVARSEFEPSVALRARWQAMASRPAPAGEAGTS